jgi:hypothetical protein
MGRFTPIYSTVMPMETASKASSICGMPKYIYTPASRYPNKRPANVAAIFKNYMTVSSHKTLLSACYTQIHRTPSLDGRTLVKMPEL